MQNQIYFLYFDIDFFFFFLKERKRCISVFEKKFFFNLKGRQQQFPYGQFDMVVTTLYNQDIKIQIYPIIFKLMFISHSILTFRMLKVLKNNKW